MVVYVCLCAVKRQWEIDFNSVSDSFNVSTLFYYVYSMTEAQLAIPAGFQHIVTHTININCQKRVVSKLCRGNI